MVRDITESDPRRSGRGRRVAVIAGAVIVITILVLLQLRPWESPAPSRALGPALPKSIGLLALDARDYSHGWLATGTGAPPTQLWQTLDGGKSWKAALALEGTGFFSGIHFFDPQHGYVLLLTPAFDLKPNTLMVTSDGGIGWRSTDFPKPLGLALASLDETSAGVGKALFVAGANGDFGRQAAVLYTTQDGVRWSLTAGVDSDHIISNGLSLVGSKGPMAFVDPLHGVMVNKPDIGGFGVYSTADGGLNWSYHPLTPPAGEHQSLGPGSANLEVIDGELLLGVAYRASVTPAAAFVFRSADGGSTWSQPVKVPTTDGLTAPCFAGTKVWWIADTGAVEVTVDGGRNWLRTDLGLPKNDHVHAVYPIDDRRAWAFAGGLLDPPNLLYETTDGGTTWSIHKPPA